MEKNVVNCYILFIQQCVKFIGFVGVKFFVNFQLNKHFPCVLRVSLFVLVIRVVHTFVCHILFYIVKIFGICNFKFLFPIGLCKHDHDGCTTVYKLCYCCLCRYSVSLLPVRCLQYFPLKLFFRFVFLNIYIEFVCQRT